MVTARDSTGWRHGCLGDLQKPCNMKSLNQLVRNILDSGL
jgi:hypothetical protein